MSSGFVSETEIAEAKRRRQEEWEKVRTSDQPEEAPEEPYDPRPLFQRLEEQKNKKDADYEEAHKLKNMIRGLDDDEVSFLEMVEQSKASVARQISLEERREMQEFRERVSSVQDSVERERLQQIAGVKQTTTKKPSSVNTTRNILQGAIVRKRKTSEGDPKNGEPAAKIPANTLTSQGDTAVKENGHVTSDNGKSESIEESKPTSPTVKQPILVQGGMRCIGILPGIGPYRDSSDSDCSSDSDNDHSQSHYDLLGRKQEVKHKSEDSSAGTFAYRTKE